MATLSLGIGFMNYRFNHLIGYRILTRFELLEYKVY
jgi:hypothetical protein